MKTVAYLKYLVATTIAAHAIGLAVQGLQFSIPIVTLLSLFALNNLLSLVISLSIFNLLLLRGPREIILESPASLPIIAVAGMIFGDGFASPSFIAIQNVAATSALLLSTIVNIAAAITVFLVLYIFTESHSYLKRRTIIMLEDQGNGLRLRAFDPHGRYAGYDSTRGNVIMEIPSSYYHHEEDGTELLSIPLAISDFTIIADATDARNTLGSYRLSVTTIMNWEVKDVRRIHYLIREGSVQAYDLRIESDGKIWVNTSNYLPRLVAQAKSAFDEDASEEQLLAPPPEAVLDSSQDPETQ